MCAATAQQPDNKLGAGGGCDAVNAPIRLAQAWIPVAEVQNSMAQSTKRAGRCNRSGH